MGIVTSRNADYDRLNITINDRRDLSVADVEIVKILCDIRVITPPVFIRDIGPKILLINSLFHRSGVSVLSKATGVRDVCQFYIWIHHVERIRVWHYYLIVYAHLKGFVWFTRVLRINPIVTLS